jgi:nicotinate-nucleotide pyrophosphorylase (carboxylating)
MAAGPGKVFRILLDNFQPGEVANAVRIIKDNSAKASFETEASGGITMDNIVEYAKAGVDYVSIGALIHQARSLDLSLKAVIV